jgi:hypothetical protein
LKHFGNGKGGIVEPITTVIASAVALGATAVLKTTVEQAVKDAYAGLKRVIMDRYQHKAEVIDAVEDVTKRPDVERRRAVLEEALTDAGATGDPVLLAAAKAVHTAVATHAPDLAQGIGMDIGTLKAAILEVENVQAAAGGIGVKIDTAEIAGQATFKNIGGGGSRPNC